MTLPRIIAKNYANSCNNDDVKDLLERLWTARQGTSSMVISNFTVRLLNSGSLKSNGSLKVDMRKRPR